MVPSCTNDKSSICTAWIQWCLPVKTTRAVYVLHGFNGAVLYKRQEQYMYCMDSMVRPVQTTRAVYVPHRLNGAVLYKRQELYMWNRSENTRCCNI